MSPIPRVRSPGATGGSRGAVLVLLVIAAMMAASTLPIFVRYRDQPEQAVSRVVGAASASMPASDSENEDESWEDEEWNKALEEAEKMAAEALSNSGQAEADRGTGRLRAPSQ
jgi:hypothetical protein